jgi:hypothetical protein
MIVTVLNFSTEQVFQLQVPKEIQNLLDSDSNTDFIQDWLTEECCFKIDQIQYMVHDDEEIYDETNL